MSTWALLLLGWGGASIFCTLLIFGACIVSSKATQARERERLAREGNSEQPATFKGIKAAFWRI
jgi:hypothetical protein